MKKVITAISIALFSLLFITLVPKPISAHGTCPPERPQSSCFPTEPPLVDCIAHGYCQVVKIHWCCSSSIPTPGKYFEPSTCDKCVFEQGGVCLEKVEGLDTAIGCIPTDPSEFIYVFRSILIGIGAGIAFLLMIVGAFFVLSSQGVPERLQRGKEIFTGAIIGLLLIIFSVFILDLIGIDILGLFS